jgi:hypothetical protein
MNKIPPPQGDEKCYEVLNGRVGRKLRPFFILYAQWLSLAILFSASVIGKLCIFNIH